MDSPELNSHAVGLEEASSEIAGRHTCETDSANSNSDSVDSGRSRDFEPAMDSDSAAAACNRRSEPPETDPAETQDIPSSSSAAVVRHFADTTDLSEPTLTCRFDSDWQYTTSNPASAYSRTDSASEFEKRAD